MRADRRQGRGARQFTAALRGIAVDRRDRVYAAGDSGTEGLRRRRASCSGAGAPPSPGSPWRLRPMARCMSARRDRSRSSTAPGSLSDTWRDAGAAGPGDGDRFSPRTTCWSPTRRTAASAAIDAGGKFLNDIGKDNRMKGFLIPNGVVDFGVDAKGVIHAANPGKHRVERYTPDGRTARAFRTLRRASTRPASPAAAIRPTWP